MKKTLTILASLLLFTACTPSPTPLGTNLPYRVWESWEEMKEVLGDHYLYPTYLPEVVERSERVHMRSDYNSGSRNRESDELFFGYSVIFLGGRLDDEIFINFMGITSSTGVTGRMIVYTSVPPTSQGGMFTACHDHSIMHRWRICCTKERDSTSIMWPRGGVEIAFFSTYGTFLSPDDDPNEWNIHHPRNARIVHYAFDVDTVTYVMSWAQFNVEDKYADDEQRESMLRVARSIIEQVKGGE